MQKHNQKNENAAAAAEAKCENAEAEEEEVERMCKMNNSVETAGEAGGRHPQHPGLHTVYEEASHIVFHTEHVEHDMNDDTGERTKTVHGEQIDIAIENEKNISGSRRN